MRKIVISIMLVLKNRDIIEMTTIIEESEFTKDSLEKKLAGMLKIDTEDIVYASATRLPFNTSGSQTKQLFNRGKLGIEGILNASYVICLEDGQVHRIDAEGNMDITPEPTDVTMTTPDLDYDYDVTVFKNGEYAQIVELDD